MILHIDKIKKNNHRVTLVDSEAFDKIQHLFMIKKKEKEKTPNKLRIKGNSLNLIKYNHKRITADTALGVERLDTHQLQSATRQECFLSHSNVTSS